jgi:tetratricopeptide (TPR) repeat protein
MNATLGPRLQQLIGEMTRARELTEAEHYEDARQAYLKLRGECVRAGIRSAHVAWGLAVVFDGLGDFEAAMTSIREALEIDPLAIPYQRSFQIIVERIRKSLGDDGRDPVDPSTPRLYELLVQAGEGDVGSHLAMARYLHHTKDESGAMKILEALTTLAPSCRQAWIQKAIVARALGNSAKAQEADIEAAALDAHDRASFAVAARARS